MPAAAIVSAVLALMPQVTGDTPTLSSLTQGAGGAATGALTAAGGDRAGSPAPLPGFGAFACSRTAERRRCELVRVRRGHRVRVDYVAFARSGIARTHVSAVPLAPPPPAP